MPQKAFAFQLPFIKKEQIAKNVYSFYFDRIKSEFDFLPGQYVRLVLPHEDADERGTSRFFTISSSPLNKEHLILTTKLPHSTFKNTLFYLEPGQQVQFFGPLGRLFLQEDETNEQVFLAGGIGITPFHSMLQFAAKKQMQVPLTLLVSFAEYEEALFYEELTSLAKQQPNIKVIYTLSGNYPVNWGGEKGRISEPLLRKYIGDLQKPIYSLTGPLAMVDSLRQLLESLSIDSEKIIVEDFTGY